MIVAGGQWLWGVLRSSPELPRPRVVAENAGWSIFLPGTPVAADGDCLDEATSEFVIALREYAEDWEGRRHTAPNHRSNWLLACFLRLMPDAELANWVRDRSR